MTYIQPKKTCCKCKKVKKPHSNTENGPVCNKCYEQPKKICYKCGENKKIYSNTENGPVCNKCCELPKKICCKCNKNRIVAKNTKEGPICIRCYRTPKKPCCKCGKNRNVIKNTKHGPVCDKCYKPPKKICCKCNKIKEIYKNTEDGSVCGTCYSRKRKRKKEKCIICNKVEEIKYRKYGPICIYCYKTPLRKCAECKKLTNIHSNKNGISLCRNCFRKKKYKEDEPYRIKKIISSRLREALKKYSKSGKIKETKEYGICYNDIFNHIGPSPGKDYHIDHIFPLSAFDFNNEKHIKAAFAPENHQWLINKENLHKHANYNKEEFERYLKNILEVL